MAGCQENFEEEEPRQQQQKPRKQEKKKRKQNTKFLAHATSDGPGEECYETKDRSSEKKATKQDNKKRSRCQEATNNMVQDLPDSNEHERKARKKMKRESEKKTKEELLDLIPKKDESSGISYTKLQIRRMMKRVKRGLPPIPTAQEEEERLKNEAMLRREEKAELAGIVMTNNESTTLDSNVNSDSESVNNGNDQDNVVLEDNEQRHRNPVKDDDDDDGVGDVEVFRRERDGPNNRIPKRIKPVPPDYTCQACKNQHNPPHWIYDCPDKVTVRGTNEKKKRERGFHDPDSRKVFVSGLPFDVKSKDICAVLEPSCGKISSCKLLTFQDTKRCNGQAIVTLATDQAAAMALKLSGTKIDWSILSRHKSQKGRATTSDRWKDLKLKVTKVLNRAKTKTKIDGISLDSGFRSAVLSQPPSER
jgi:hypothetical protein